MGGVNRARPNKLNAHALSEQRNTPYKAPNKRIEIGTAMPRIDTSSIEGYADMSPEDKVAALESFEYQDHADEVRKLSADVSRYKSATTKASSEAAEYKRQLNEAVAKGDKGKVEYEKKLSDFQKRLDAMQHDNTVSENKANFVGLGYDTDLAASSAKALADGDTQTLFDNMRKFNEAHDKKVKAQYAQHDILPGGSTDPDKDMTRKRLLAMSPIERNEFSARHPEEFKKLMGR